jgi:hypothetical protein
MRRILQVCASTVLLALCALAAHSATPSGVGVRAGAGTDISGGVAYGGGVNYLYSQDGSGAWELGLVGYGGKFEETTVEMNTYVEKTTVAAFGVLVNRLVKYKPGMRGPFTVFGLGAGVTSVSWEERSATDITLGTRLASGGSMQSADGTGGGILFNLGVGYVFGGPVDLRLEVPIIINSNAPGNSSSVIPALTLTAGMRY